MPRWPNNWPLRGRVVFVYSFAHGIRTPRSNGLTFWAYVHILHPWVLPGLLLGIVA